MRCRKCGKETLDVDKEGYCEDCQEEDEEAEDDEEMTDEEMDDFATCVINSPFNPGLN